MDGGAAESAWDRGVAAVDPARRRRRPPDPAATLFTRAGPTGPRRVGRCGGYGPGRAGTGRTVLHDNPCEVSLFNQATLHIRHMLLSCHFWIDIFAAVHPEIATDNLRTFLMLLRIRRNHV